MIGTERGFRLIGLGLQLIGILTVAYNLRGTRRQFDRPNLFVLLAQWWRERPKFRYPPIIAGMSVTIAPATMTARAQVWNTPKPDATVDQRVSTLERNLDLTRDWLSAVERSVDNNKNEINGFLKLEQHDRAASDNAITEALRQSQIGGLYISSFGIICLIIGSIMSSASIEFFVLINYL